jgi:hypothetical protein
MMIFKEIDCTVGGYPIYPAIMLYYNTLLVSIILVEALENDEREFDSLNG